MKNNDFKPYIKDFLFALSIMVLNFILAYRSPVLAIALLSFFIFLYCIESTKRLKRN